MPGDAKPSRHVVRPPVHTSVVEYLLQDIQRGVYLEGEELPSEREMMQDFGVGRPAIRESLYVLKRMGLIEIRSGMRSRIRKPTLKPLLNEMRETLQIYTLSEQGERELQEFRQLFESMLVRELCRTITEDQLQWLGDSLERQHAALRDIPRFAQLDIEFHSYIGECLANPLIGTFAGSMADWLANQRHQSLKVRGQAKNALQGHQAIFDALQNHNPDMAEQAVRDHLAGVSKAYFKVRARELEER